MAEKELTVAEAQVQVREFLQQRGWWPADTEGRYYTMLHAMEEMGELSRCITHLESKRAEVDAKRNAPVSTVAQLEMELGDLFFHLLKIADAYNLELSHAFEVAIAKDHAKFPLETYKDSGF